MYVSKTKVLFFRTKPFWTTSILIVYGFYTQYVKHSRNIINIIHRHALGRGRECVYRFDDKSIEKNQ